MPLFNHFVVFQILLDQKPIEERPYLGCFIAALLSQRQNRLVDIGISVAKTVSQILVENLGEYAQNLDADVLAQDRGFKQVPDPFVLWKIFQGLTSKQFPTLEDALTHYKCDGNKKRILEETCNRKSNGFSCKTSFLSLRPPGSFFLPLKIVMLLRDLSKHICTVSAKSLPS